MHERNDIIDFDKYEFIDNYKFMQRSNQKII